MSKENGSNLKEMDIDDLGIKWEKYPVEDDLKITEEKVSSDDPDSADAYIDDLATKINSEHEIVLPKSMRQEPKKGEYDFVKEQVVEPQEVQQEEERVISFTPMDNYFDSIAAERRVEAIAQLLVYMDYISKYNLGNFHKGEIRLTFDPIYQTHGAIKMATDCIMNGVNGQM